MKSPILFLIFNRPETTRRVFEAIRVARPPRLYVAADGPRAGREGERSRCNEARSIASKVDWPCEVRTLYRDHNLGCKLGVAGGVTWFFEQEAEGIILEDDVLPISTFFDFCDEMLERYRSDERVAVITGNNLVSRYLKIGDSYFFSRYPHIWGWASWRRAWSHYDVFMKLWPSWRDSRGLTTTWGGGTFVASYWRHFFDLTHNGNIDTWDYQWFFACWRTQGLTIVPRVNQTQNLGFGSDATHTTAEEPETVRLSRPVALQHPLIHPTEVKRNREADSIIDSKAFGINAISTIKRWLRTFPLIDNAASSLKSLMETVRR
jgi:hypothetical protein